MTLLLFVAAAVAGCLAGRLLGRPLKICPYRLGAQVAAVVPILVGLGMLALPEGATLALQGTLAGAGAAVGVFLTGHRSRLLACTGALLGSLLGAGIMEAARHF